MEVKYLTDNFLTIRLSVKSTEIDICNTYLTARDPEQRVAHMPPMVAPGPTRPDKTTKGPQLQHP